MCVDLGFICIFKEVGILFCSVVGVCSSDLWWCALPICVGLLFCWLFFDGCFRSVERVLGQECNSLFSPYH